MMCSFCWLVTRIMLSEPKEIHSVHLSEVFLSIGQIFRHIYLFNCKYNVSRIITPILKIFVIKVVILQLGISKASTETHSIGIHDEHLFNTELAMHYRAIFKYGCFRLFCEWIETLLLCFCPDFS